VREPVRSTVLSAYSFQISTSALRLYIEYKKKKWKFSPENVCSIPLREKAQFME
jgi:hypothetical protein